MKTNKSILPQKSINKMNEMLLAAASNLLSFRFIHFKESCGLASYFNSVERYAGNTESAVGKIKIRKLKHIECFKRAASGHRFPSGKIYVLNNFTP